MRAFDPPTMTLKCQACGADFVKRTALVLHYEARGTPLKYCSRTCMGRGQSAPLTQDTVLDLSIPEPNSGCWLWLGSINPGNGYGRISLAHIPAHRFSYTVFKGAIPDGMVVRHSCDNPLCVNPEHLSVGTVADNKNDAVVRKRHAHGSKQGRAILSEEDVPKVRQMLAAGISQSEVARRFGVSHSVIFRIEHQKTWKHVSGGSGGQSAARKGRAS